jgi:hypothetical protein
VWGKASRSAELHRDARERGGAAASGIRAPGGGCVTVPGPHLACQHVGRRDLGSPQTSLSVACASSMAKWQRGLWWVTTHRKPPPPAG